MAIDKSVLGGRMASISGSMFAGVGYNPLDPMGIGQFWGKFASNTVTHAEVDLWLDRDAREHRVDDGTTACGRYYQYLKHEMQKSLDEMAEPWRTNFKDMLLHNANLQEVMRSPMMAEQFRYVDSIIRKRYPDEHGELYNPEYNHQFLTEDSTGTIVAMDDAAVVALFAQRGAMVGGKGEVFPHIIITSSHAQGETLSDVTGITHGIEAMARDSEGKALPHAHIDTGIAPGKTLTLFACDVEKSPLLNGAALLDRINELKRIQATGKVEKEFKDISPGAKRIAKLMLKCMVEEPAAIDTKEARSMREIGEQNETKLRLRPDAVEIAHHFQLIGYSKGGNVVSDAMRYLVSELTAKNARGEDVFEISPESPVVNGDGTAMNPHNVSKIVRNIAVLALASVEVGMNAQYKANGVRRVAINSDKDLISAHHNYPEGILYDERWIIKGVERNVGHAPQDMMGTRLEQVRGYAHDDPRVARRLKEFYAPNYGKAAIGHLKFDEAAKGEITIEAATGTTDAQMWAFKDDITKAFVKAGLKKVEFIDNPLDPGIFTMKCAADFAHEPLTLMKFRKAFEQLHDNADGLLITQNIDEEILSQLQDVGLGGALTRREQAKPSTHAAAR